LNSENLAIITIIMVSVLVSGTAAEYAFAESRPIVAHDPCAKIVVREHNPNCGGPRPR
jgi:hypothetical protein